MGGMIGTPGNVGIKNIAVALSFAKLVKFYLGTVMSKMIFMKCVPLNVPIIRMQ